MSILGRNDEDHLSLAQRLASDEILVEETHEPEIRLALQELGGNPGAASSAGKHGLVRIPLEPEKSPDEFFADLYKHLEDKHSPALRGYGRNRQYAIEVLSTGLPDPKSREAARSFPVRIRRRTRVFRRRRRTVRVTMPGSAW